MTEITPEEWHTRFTAQAHWTAALRKYLFEQLHLPAAARILEVGCGTGALLNEWRGGGNSNTQTTVGAHGVRPSGVRPHVGYTQETIPHGLDIDLPSLRLCAHNAPGAVLTQGDAHRLPYAADSFDAVYCHFLLLWVADPVQVVAEMKRVARPGAAVLALAEPDYAGRIDYPAELTQLGRWQQAALTDQGADPLIGRKLAAVFRQAGLSDIQTGVLGGQWRMADPVDESEWYMVQHDLSHLVTAPELAEMHRVDVDARRKGERILFTPTFYAVGRVV